MNYLTIALTKGRLASKTLSLFEQAGIGCADILSGASRKLVVTDPEAGLRFFLAKGPDVPVYVSYGAADIGITGRDTILEEGLSVYEVLDLKIGKCRMCVCGPKEAEELLRTKAQVRVATKYPGIARRYFNQRNQSADIIRLSGSIELGPMVGLSDMIVDIVETGSTLAENGLSVIEEFLPVSARMIVNPVSMKMEHDRIAALIGSLKGVIAE